MADLSITMHGDASGAADALKHVGHEAGALHEVLEGALKGALGSTVTTFSSLETVAEKAAEMVKEFVAESVKAFAESERSQLQLKLVAGQYTDAVNEQAEALSRKMNIEVDDIRHMETLELRYGVHAAALDTTTTAVLNLAAATGKDANTAMMRLIQSVEAGTGVIKGTGIQFKVTGDFTTDMANAVEALNGRMGGAAETDAQGLAGRMRGASLALEEVHKAFGRLFDGIEKRMGLLQSVASAFNTIAKGIDEGGWGGFFHAVGLKTRAEENATPGAAAAVHLGPNGEVTFGADLPDEALGEGGDERKKKGRGASALANADQNRFMLESKIAHKIQDDDRNEEEFQQKHDEELEKIEDEHDQKMLTMKQKAYDEQLAVTEKVMKDADESSLKLQQNYTKDLQQAGDIQVGMLKSQTDAMRRELETREQTWTRAGVSIGQALISGIFQAIDAATSKNGQSGWQTADKVTQAVFSAVFGAFGMGWMTSAAFGAMNASDSGGAGSGAAAFASAGSNVRYDSSDSSFSDQQLSESGYQPPSNHFGGWIQRFHRGGWPMRGDEQLALLQTGERVLSRREVGAMGGPAGVESAVRGGGGRSLTIQAFDSSSILDFFGDRGGNGMLQAARANVGPLRQMFGGG